ncbi:phosphatidate cytidylyltransferase [Cytophagaceae bacterium DM2B3-1]|uniref:Phosphatidate cytidylyltransferase n=1 Tax=Xanthocytophaga flava TaxID=3048013 RepID=A0AAE3QTY2_9BACT|nr:phosphatidate cytidylyltransferase [Xanthocytophaga flavus]MDJ1469787.1 phosphatidate cytidylyltransferase [Xanthocytophaga flavus]MDJ1483191.1 phosphatidate cytidylyltransferase [Xanthocytophaga flavus]MDJ1494300.1 phosphatidate cytidylyltransferase [Xanthocytophaga flavus]
MMQVSEMQLSILFVVAFLLLILITEWLHKKLHVDSEICRKFLHVSGGFLTLLFPLFFKSYLWVLLLCTLAFTILLATRILGKLSSVHQVRRKSIGSVIFPIPICICFWVSENLNNTLLFHLPVLVLSISDTFAEIGGKKWGHTSMRFSGGKTLIGSIFFAASCLVISLFVFSIGSSLNIAQQLFFSLIITLCATLTESVSFKGLDNLTVPIVVLLVLTSLEKSIL